MLLIEITLTQLILNPRLGIGREKKRKIKEKFKLPT
jgi:hypothetical protein